ncbi:hypothetical protein [Nonomuraea jiangxiensis]|uniref:DinB superfamily protein n=1 Tax=Nonomuraea jiangxiensis TaxID=633440 RepID=A0A1G8WRW9_9ACTN|nr:hypothetical protein [Nonomuraea jiangxiensis]SDJ80797.1 hypothetical protein SAMN05421869_112246 [Nonomuraea jiangxiensis]
MTRVYLESGPKKVFACAIDWPGWCRIAAGEEAALDRLMEYVPRYRVVAARAGLDFSPGDPVVTGRVPGSQTTDFGVPYTVPDLDLAPVPADEAERGVALMRAAWALFDETAGGSPEELRKGPRGGGRDLAKMVAHVEEAERAYARKLGVRHRPYRSRADRDAMREELAEALSHPWEPPLTTGWPPRYGVRRIIWHVVDHLWEIEDRT